MSESNAQSEPHLDGTVAFKWLGGEEYRCPLVWLARNAATFEVQTPVLQLQAQSALSDFRIYVGQTSIYTGSAVVQQAIEGGAVRICHVSLDGRSFAGEHMASLAADNDATAGLIEFLRQWGLVYRIRPDFKVALADIHTFLTDLRRHLEVQEIGLSALPLAESIAKEKQILDQLTPVTNHALDQLFERFEQVVAQLTEAERPSYRDYAQRMLHPHVLWAPFSDRSFRKPLGYAGDHEMVAMMFREHREGASLFAKVFNVWLLHQDSSVAHRNRVQLLEERLLERVAAAHCRQRRARVFNVGCGPALEVQRFISNAPLSDHLDITLLDFNDTTIAQTNSAILESRNQHGRMTQIQTIVKSVQQLLKESASRVPKASYDYVYCAGLFDYLPDRICQRLMTLFYSMLNPGGVVLATNVTPKNPNRGSMEFALDWYLVYRDAGGMKSILPDGVGLNQSRMYCDDTGTNIFLEVDKPDAN